MNLLSLVGKGKPVSEQRRRDVSHCHRVGCGRRTRRAASALCLETFVPVCLGILICLLMPGCVIVKVGVTNPIDGLSTVAVAPFFNLSQERAVDGRRFAMAYYAELQKVPGFQVLPVGVTEQKITDHRLEMDKPEDVLALARLLKVDAVVVGAVTDYDPYYPPRIGLHVEWYSPRPWGFSPGIPTDPQTRTQWRDAVGHRWRIGNWHRHHDDGDSSQANGLYQDTAQRMSMRAQSPEPVRVSPQSAIPSKFDPHKPLMSYTRIFDGVDADLLATMRDYVELSGNQRGGGWEAYLHRSEDFIRFTAHLMIVEMLTLHGGDARRQIVFKLRKYK